MLDLNIDQNYYCSNYYDASVNKCKVKCATSLKFWGNKSCISSIDPYGWFQWYFRYWLGRRSLNDERQIARWKRIVNRFKGKLVKMIKHINGRFDDYSISPEIRQILLHWSYELVESNLLWFIFFVHIKMSYYWFNRQKLLQKAKVKKKLLNIILIIKKF